LKAIITEEEAFGYAFQEFSAKVQLSENDKMVFRSLFKLRAVKRKDFLLKQGEVCKYDYFIVKGCLRSFYLDDNLAEQTRRFAVEGWWAGNLLSFLRATPSEYHVMALEDTWVLRINRLEMERLYAQAPVFERYFRGSGSTWVSSGVVVV
jgi:CRP-like cAMP-binding protein